MDSVYVVLRRKDGSDNTAIMGVYHSMTDAERRMIDIEASDSDCRLEVKEMVVGIDTFEYVWK